MTCSSANPSSCSKCIDSPSVVLHQGSCIPQCPSDHFKNQLTKVCQLCNSICKTCINATSIGCLSCEPPKFLVRGNCQQLCPNQMYQDQVTYQCRPCHVSCLACTGGLSTQCSSCEQKMYAYQNQCLQTCPSGTFNIQSNFSCAACHSTCKTCSGAAINQCLSCAPPRSLNTNTSTCVTSCPAPQISVIDQARNEATCKCNGYE